MLIKLSDTEIWNKDRIEHIYVDEHYKTVYATIWEGAYYEDGSKVTRRIGISPSFLNQPKDFSGKTAEEFIDILWQEILDNKNGDVDIVYLLDDYLNKH